MASTLPKQFPTTATSLRGLEFIFHKVPASFKADRVTDLRVNSPLIIPRFSLNSNSWAVLFPHLIRPFKSDQETITGRFPSDFGSWINQVLFSYAVFYFAQFQLLFLLLVKQSFSKTVQQLLPVKFDSVFSIPYTLGVLSDCFVTGISNSFPLIQRILRDFAVSKAPLLSAAER